MTNKEKISLGALTAFYILCILRYFPGNLLKTITATTESFLTLGPFAIALTIIIVTIIQKVVGEKLPWDRIFRFYLMFAILIEIFAGVYNYLALNQS